MANQFVTLPVPAGNGSGAAVDVSSFGALKTCVFSRGDANEDISITLEFSNDAGGVSWAPLVTQQGSGTFVVQIACRWLRCTVSNYKRGTPNDVEVGGTDDGTSFVTLTVPVVDGPGPSTNISALQIFQTVQVGGGQYAGNISLELSEDGVTWGEFASFQQGAIQFSTQLIVAQFARARRNGIPAINPGSPTMAIGATFPPGGSPSSSDGNAQRFQYTVDGTEPDLTELTIPLPVGRANANYLVFPAQEEATNIVGMSVDTASKTTTEFVLSLTGEASIGDVFSFNVVDPT